MIKSSTMEIYTEDDMREILRKRCEGDRQSLCADEIGISPSFVSLILSGHRGISASTAERLGYERKVVYVPKSNRDSHA